MTNWLRKNVGIIVSSIGMLLLVILTFGDIGELFTEAYWHNVGGNISSIGALTIGLVMIQVTIKQGVSEQALSAGLNTETTKNKYNEHKQIVNKCKERQIYLPYFLSIRNKRETIRRKKEFLVDNNFTSAKMLYLSGNKRLIKTYEKIKTNITVDSIKWSTTKIVYTKNGRIEKLDEYRKKRLIKALITGFFYMFASTLIAGGLFLDVYDIPLWQKIVRLFAYIIVIAITVIFDIGKNYEKGAFGVPNELDEVNGIWQEFDEWEIPEWVQVEVEKNSIIDAELNENKIEEVKLNEVHEDDITTFEETIDEACVEDNKCVEQITQEDAQQEEKIEEIKMEETVNEQEQENTDIRADLQEEQKKVESV